MGFTTAALAPTVVTAMVVTWGEEGLGEGGDRGLWGGGQWGQ